ncbi:MAG: sirohydrochlorin chelatase [Dissulfurimicrobium hydrothermale]|uniref:sirohydrochlorin chelatase n=1 Tax=Dissulfurimicrobium hydrothermale TaxID=1750598 RepID=UPI003C722C4A
MTGLLKTRIFSLILTIALSIFIPFVVAARAETERGPGILVIAHGTDDPTWTGPVSALAEELKKRFSCPVALGYLEATKPDIPGAVDELNSRGVNRIIAVPLFISSYSNHIEEIRYILGLKDTPPGGENLVKADPAGEVELTRAIDDNPFLVETLAEQIVAMLDATTGFTNIFSRKTAILAMHGSDTPEGMEGWERATNSLEGRLYRTLSAQGWGFERDDIRHGYLFEKADPQLGDVVYHAIFNEGKIPYVIPVMLSEGYFTGSKIPSILKPVENMYRYPEKGKRSLITFDKKALTKMVVYRAANSLWMPPLILKNGRIVEFSLDRVYEISGEICPGRIMAWRAASYGLAKLWGDTVVNPSDLFVVSMFPPKAEHKELFDWLAGVDNVAYIGQSYRGMTEITPTFSFIDRATGRFITVRTKKDIFGGDEFFELKNKAQAGKITREEGARLKRLKEELLLKLMTTPPDMLFDVVSASL